MEINETALKYKSQPLQDGKYTYADYAKWPDDGNRYELIDGYVYKMSGTLRIHQEISGNLCGLLWNYLRGKPCEIYAAPFDIRLNGKGDEDDTVVQPDISVICDCDKLDDIGCNGAPDLIIEILSYSSFKYDRLIKFNKYLQTCVREYWIVNPTYKSVDVFILNEGRYDFALYSEDDTIDVHVLEGCQIALRDIFEI